MEYDNPKFFFLLIFVALFLIWDLRHGFGSGFGFYFGSSYGVKKNRFGFLLKTTRAAKYLVLILIVFAMAQPVKRKVVKNINFSGIDIFIVLDISNSMSGQDFKPKNRLYVAKKVIQDFVDKRKSDRIGLVVFAGEAYLQCPLTLDYNVLKSIVAKVNFSSVQEGGTAIGNAVGLASSLLYKNKTKSKIIILLTDGVNNRGAIEPLTVAQAARPYGIKIYTIGIGKKGEVTGFINQPGGRRSSFRFYNHYDERMLRSMAEVSQGRFFSAVNSHELYQTIQEIDRLEKTIFQEKKFSETEFYYHYFLWLAAIIFLFILFVEKTYVQRFP